MEILPDTGCLVPFKKVDSSLKKNIIVHAISHVEELLYMLEENDVSLGKYEQDQSVNILFLLQES